MTHKHSLYPDLGVKFKTLFLQPSMPVICMMVLLLITGLIGFFFTYYIAPGMIGDEEDIIIPVIQHIKGIPYVFDKYPMFPFLFYEVIIRAFLTVGGSEGHIHALSRIVNLILYLINIWLFFITVKPHLNANWSFFAAILFAFSPVIFFSGIYVKTEALLLMEILIFLICINNILLTPNRKLWHIGAGISCGLAITTKYFIPLIFFYLISLTQIKHANEFYKIKSKFKFIIKNYHFGWFIFFSIATVIITWPDAFHFINDITSDNLKNDLYFNPRPSFFKAVDESGSFPYGRYSSALWFAFPIGVGLLNYSFALLGLITNSIPRKILWIWGFGFLFYIIYTFNMTLMRIFWMFTPVVPFIILCSVCFIKKIFYMEKNKFVFLSSILGIILLLTFSFYQFPAVTIWMNEYGKIVLNSKVPCCMGHSRFYNNSEVDVLIKRYEPQKLILLDSYFYNFCKYKKNEIYQRQCRFFNSMIAEKEDYQVVGIKSIDFPTKKFTFDPESSFTYYYMVRKPGAVQLPDIEN